MGEQGQELAAAVAAAALAKGVTVAAAESVTAGGIATALATGESASEWFSGSVVAYRTDLKQRLLGVSSDRVITRACAHEMVIGVRRVTGADVAVAVTGVGGPDPEEEMPPGTVYIAVAVGDEVRIHDHAFEGPPEEVVAQATKAALGHLSRALL